MELLVTDRRHTCNVLYSYSSPFAGRTGHWVGRSVHRNRADLFISLRQPI